MKSTRRKFKRIGIEEYVNKDTGEVIEMQVISVEERDANFQKIWLIHLADALDLIGNQKTKVFFHIMENLNENNQYIGTQRSIAEKLRTSTQTVTLALKSLKDADAIRQPFNGVYQVNPDMVFKGGTGKRMSVLIDYNNVTRHDLTDELEVSSDHAAATV